MKIKINKGKRIGKVVFICEGDKTELDYLKFIFNDLLKYNLHKKNRYDKNIDQFDGVDDFSHVYVISLPNGNCLKNIPLTNVERDEIFHTIYELDKNIDLKNSSVYYIWDRDCNTNTLKDVENAINIYTCSQNDSETPNGLLLLSYPCVESFLLNCYEKNSYIKNRHHQGHADLKALINQKRYKARDLKFKDLENGTHELLNFFQFLCEYDFKLEDLDDFKEHNKKILDVEEQNYQHEDKYFCISNILLALIDLQIIELVID